jgi:dUTP pyrophosphatase
MIKKRPGCKVLKVKKLCPDSRIPVRANPDDAGLDLFAQEDTIIPGWGKAVLATGISVQVPAGHYGRIASRSGLSVNEDIEVGAGVVDTSYRGQLKVVLRRFRDEAYEVKKGDKIAQFILEKISVMEPMEVAELDETQRQDKGFGSSGI